MKRFLWLAVIVVAAGSALWLYARRDALRLQWECYQVTRAANYQDFQQRMEQFERRSRDSSPLEALVARWHTGNERFDDFLASYLFDPQCSDRLREAFSRELSWRQELPAAWARHWRAQKPDVDGQIASLRRYLEALEAAGPPRTITWRDVLDFQAVLVISRHEKLAHRLTPDNWRGRFARWQAAE